MFEEISYEREQERIERAARVSETMPCLLWAVKIYINAVSQVTTGVHIPLFPGSIPGAATKQVKDRKL